MLTNKEIIDVLRQSIRDAGSLRKWAKLYQFEPSTVSKCVTGGKPFPAVAKVLGYKRTESVWEEIK